VSLCIVSNDGSSWDTGKVFSDNIYLSNIKFINGEFWVGSISPYIFSANHPISDTCILKSSDGLNWIAVTTPTSNKWLVGGISYGNGYYVAPVSDSTLSENGNLISSNGIDFEYVKSNIQIHIGAVFSSAISDIVFGDGVFVATTYSDVDCQIMYSTGPYQTESGTGRAVLKIIGGLDIKNEVQIDSTPIRPLDAVLGKSAATGDTVVSRSVDSLDVDSARAAETADNADSSRIAGSVDGFSISGSTVTSTSYFTAPDNDTLKRISVSNTLASLGLSDSLITKKVRADRVHVDSIWHAYGGFQDSAVVVDIVSSNTWYHVTNASGTLWTGLEGDGITMSGDTVIIANAGDYPGSISITVNGVTATDYHFRVFNVTQNEQSGFITGATTEGTGNYTNISFNVYLEANAGDRFVMQVENTSSTQDITFEHANFYISYLHD
jgi:hypothetical protein